MKVKTQKDINLVLADVEAELMDILDSGKTASYVKSYINPLNTGSTVEVASKVTIEIASDDLLEI